MRRAFEPEDACAGSGSWNSRDSRNRVLFSANRKAIRWYTVAWGFALQILFAFLVLYWETGKNALERFSLAVTGAISYADQGGSFVFGWLTGPMNRFGEVTGLPIGGYIFAFKVLPIIIFIASFFTILYYLGIMQRVVQAMAYVMQRLMKVSGAESLAVAANVFIGQTEAPILIAPYIPTMTRSELLTMMTGGMAHVSGAVLLAYVAMGIPAEYLITASVMAAPGAILMAKILMPETEVPATMGRVRLSVEKTHTNLIDAAASGASQGMTLVINIVAMLIAFIALIALVNGFLGWVGRPLRLSRVPAPDGLRMAPVASGGRHGRSDSRRGEGRRPHRKQDRHQRVLRLRENEHDPGGHVREGAAHRLLRALRVRQLLLDRDPDRGDRRPRPDAQGGPRTAGVPSPARRVSGVLPDGHDRGPLASF